MIIDQDFYDLAELAALVKKSESTVRRWVREGRFPPGAQKAEGPVWSRDVLLRHYNKGQCPAREVDRIAKFA